MPAEGGPNGKPDPKSDPSSDAITPPVSRAETGEILSVGSDSIETSADLESGGSSHVADDFDERIGSLIERAASSPHARERIDCFVEAARLYEQSGELDKAFITLQAAVAEDYTDAGSTRALGDLAARLDRKRELLEEFRSTVAEIGDAGQRVGLLLMLARWHEDLGEPGLAESKVQKALAIDGSSLTAIGELSRMYRARKDSAALATHLSNAGGHVRRTPDRVALLLESAELHRSALGDSQRAAELYGQVLDLDPNALPALEALTDIAWQDENWAKALPLLERLAGIPERPAADRARVLQRAALTALRIGEDQRSREHARALVDLDAGGVDFLRDWLDIAVSRHWWPDVGLIGNYLRSQPDFALPLGEQAELAARIGRSWIEAGDPEAAIEELETALRLDPNHRRAREQLAELLDRKGDASGALEHKRRLAEGVAAPDERFRLLIDMARTERDTMKNPGAALAAFEEARELRPQDRTILTEMLDLYSDAKQWLPASEILLSLAESETPPARARYLVAAANILHYELDESDQALELFDRALDDDPTDLKTFERQDKIYTARRDWKEEARAYRRMIKRVGAATDDTKKAALLQLWRGLGEVLRTRLGDHTSAITAYEVCVQLDPEGSSDREALSELAEASGNDGLQAAAQHRTTLIEKSDDGPTLVRQLQALRRIFSQAGLWDRVYNVCAALTVLQAADAEERGFYEQIAGQNLTLAQAALTEEVWQKVIYDPKEERRLSLLFSCVAPVIALARMQEGKAFGLKDKQRLDPAGDPSGVARLFDFGAGMLNLQPAPAVYLNPEATTEVEIINLRDHVGSGGSIMISPGIVVNRVEKDVAFVVGRTLALTRTDHLVLSRHIVPSMAELTAVVHAAFKLCQPSASLPNPATYEPYLQLFKKALPPQALEPLSSLVPWLNENVRTLDLETWRTAVERTADRAGLLMCGDLGAAVRVIHATRGMSAGPAVLDLVRWSVSDGHLGLRELLGVALAPPAS